MKRKVLIIDDSLMARHWYRMSLSGCGFDVVVAGNGIDGLKELHWRPDTDIVLLDLEMPEGSGIEVLREIRRNPEFERVQVVLLTSGGDENEAARGLSLGADGAIEKFSDPQQVRRFIGKQPTAGNRSRQPVLSSLS